MSPLLMPIDSHGVRPGSDDKLGDMNDINGCAAWWSHFGVPGKAHGCDDTVRSHDRVSAHPSSLALYYDAIFV